MTVAEFQGAPEIRGDYGLPGHAFNAENDYYQFFQVASRRLFHFYAPRVLNVPEAMRRIAPHGFVRKFPFTRSLHESF